MGRVLYALRVTMKTTFKVLGSVVALGCVILLIIHVVLLRGLTRTMRDVVLPQLKADTGIDAKIGRLSINVAAGKLYLNDLEVRNPEGFLLENLASVERVEVEVGLASLIKQKPILVRNIEVENAIVNVVRNRDGELNLNQLEQELPILLPIEGGPERRPPPEHIPKPPPSAPPPEEKPLPEILLQRIWCKANVRYVDLNYRDVDLTLDLDIKGLDLSTQSALDTPWGAVAVRGSLGNDYSRFRTDLSLRLAPLIDPATPSFDLTGRIMEIDPQIMADLQESLDIRTDPFGLEPEFHCREGWFERSQIALELRNIKLEHSISRKIGGMGAIESLRFIVPVTGSLNSPVADFQSALLGALGGNTRSLLEAFLKGQTEKYGGTENMPGSLSDAAVEALGKEVEEIGESETAKRILKDLADGKPSDTNAPSTISSDTIVNILGEQVKEIGEDEELKDELKNLGKWLFGK